jgi:dipeptidyl-peptidase-4
MTCMAMFMAPGVYSAGAAVAPVTEWHAYDTIYTERYMKHPQDNEEGYKESAPVNFVAGLEAPFLLVHGTADDNVHMANSLKLVHELIDAGKDFDLMLYPRKLHGISGEKARVHLYRRLTKFFDENLMNTEPESTSLP